MEHEKVVMYDAVIDTNRQVVSSISIVIHSQVLRKDIN